MKPMGKVLLAALALAAGVTSSRAEVGGGRIVVEYAEKAISKGYGAMCSLAMVPVKTGGYYHCIDFGPYRYVKGYESVAAFVVQQGKAPYQVMGGTPQKPVFVIEGPWAQDLPTRVIAYWNDVVQGGAERLLEAQETAGRKKAAEEYIGSLVKKERPVELDVAGEKKDDGVASDVLKDEIGKPVTSTDLKEALQAVGQ
ncbi:hypothetical protein GOB57_21405 [Sinorhizobium meliloti]|nr:hypothetical protein [Sinorhizobium meliloti]